MINFFKHKYVNLFSDSRFSEILTGSAWALSARVIATALGLMFSVMVARFYGAEVVGILAVINSFLVLATILTIMGTNTSILRLIPEHMVRYSPKSAFKVYRKTQFMVIGMSVITSSVFFFGANLIADKVFSKPNLSYYFALSSVFLVFKSMMELNTQAVRGLRLIKLFALMQFLPQIFNLVLLIALGLLWPARDCPVYAVLISFAMTGIIGWIIMEQAFKNRMQPDNNVHNLSVRSILSISLPMLMTATSTFLIAQSGVLILSMFSTEAEVGHYAIAVKLATLTSFVLRAVDSMAGPKFSELFYANKMDELFHIAKKSAKLIFVTTAPLLLGFLIYGKQLLGMVFGNEFSAAYPALIILALGQFANSISGSTGMFLNMTGNQNIFRNIMVIAATLNILLNVWLVPKFSINGAAIAATVSLCFWNVSALVYLKLKFGKTTGYFPTLT